MPTFLRYLDRGSVILFGPCKSTDHFVIDTVLVVNDWIDYECHNFLTVAAPRIHPTCTAVTISALWQHDFLAEGERRSDPAAQDKSFRVYFGAVAAEPVEGMFSFFPCTTSSEAEVGFRRPTICIDGRITNNLLQGKKRMPLADLGEAKTLWDNVVSQAMAQGLKLGVSARMPDRRASTDVR